MKKYEVFISDNAQSDIDKLIDHIANEYKAPETAEKYLIGLYDEIVALEKHAASIQVSMRKDILHYGVNARSVKYKKVIIIYTIHINRVIVQAVKSSSAIIDSDTL